MKNYCFSDIRSVVYLNDSGKYNFVFYFYFKVSTQKTFVFYFDIFLYYLFIYKFYYIIYVCLSSNIDYVLRSCPEDGTNIVPKREQ